MDSIYCHYEVRRRYKCLLLAAYNAVACNVLSWHGKNLVFLIELFTKGSLARSVHGMLKPVAHMV